MEKIEHASINGVEVHNLVEQDCEEDILYNGDIYLDGKQIGSFSERLDKPMELDVPATYQSVLRSRQQDYLEAVADEGEKLDGEVFFLDLIELERYLQMFEQGKEEGCACLLVNYTADGVDIFNVEKEEDVEEIVKEEGFEEFQVFSEYDHFVINC